MKTIHKLIFKSTIPIIRVRGVINTQSADKVEKQISQIKTKNIEALAVVVNSPGGLPTQSDFICSKIQTLAKRYSVPVYTFAEDVAASGGYFVLCIGDKVYVDKASIVGSIGVVSQWMGFERLLQKQGVKGQIISSNNQLYSQVLNPFSAYDPEKIQQQILPKLKLTHSYFKDHVKRFRKNLDDRLFEAEVYNGEEAVNNGLADGIGNYLETLKELYPKSQFQELWLPNKWEELRRIADEY